jgi:hypothetical protein
LNLMRYWSSACSIDPGKRQKHKAINALQGPCECALIIPVILPLLRPRE